MVMPQFRLFIDLFSEGRRTEPGYIESFAEQYANGVVKVVIRRSGAHLPELVESAIELSKQQGASRYSNRHIYVVADKDELSDAELQRLCAKVATYNANCTKRHQKITLCISNPCIELWALAHFMKKKFPITAAGCQEKLKEFMPKFNHGNGQGTSLFNINLMTEDKYKQAKDLATSWCANCEHNPNGCPYTDIYILLEDIRRA